MELLKTPQEFIAACRLNFLRLQGVAFLVTLQGLVPGPPSTAALAPPQWKGQPRGTSPTGRSSITALCALATPVGSCPATCHSDLAQWPPRLSPWGQQLVHFIVGLGMN